MNTSTESTTPPTTNPTRSRALWFSAAFLSLVLLFQVGLPEATAFAGRGVMSRGGDTASAGDYTMLNLNAGNDDVLLVLDGRGENIYVYRTKNKNTLEALPTSDLKALFARGKRMGAGNK